jgi:hypothetical protein
MLTLNFEGGGCEKSLKLSVQVLTQERVILAPTLKMTRLRV